MDWFDIPAGTLGALPLNTDAAFTDMSAEHAISTDALADDVLLLDWLESTPPPQPAPVLLTAPSPEPITPGC